ncbi:MAG: hypothetical protein O7D91_18575 [Planctomycetota bacterium]|nr:hypothetical protein [Planctomycetota bacterium]
MFSRHGQISLALAAGLLGVAASHTTGEVIQPIVGGYVSSNGNVYVSSLAVVQPLNGQIAQGVIEFDISGLSTASIAVLGILPDQHSEAWCPMRLRAFPGDGVITANDYGGGSWSQLFEVFSTGFPMSLDVTSELNEAIVAGMGFLTIVFEATCTDQAMRVFGSSGGGGDGVIENNFTLALDLDTDGDLMQNSCDNCPDEYNPDQADEDADGVGDLCDNCELPNADQADCQPNGIGDICDIAAGTSADCNENGVPDQCDSFIGDLNGDGVVDAADLAILLGSWGPCEQCPADFDGDGSVSAADLAILLGSWGPCG